MADPALKIPFLFITGCGAAAITTEYAGFAYHEKPVNPSTLIQMLLDALGRVAGVEGEFSGTRR